MEKQSRTDLVTGAFGFTGAAVARRLAARGIAVRTLTAQPSWAVGEQRSLELHPYAFDDRAALRKAFEGIHTFYNTYWVRLERGETTYAAAVRNTRRLFEAAREAGVRRVVHVSIANASPTSELPYYRGKALLERDLMESGLSHAIVRPTVIFGDGGILLNNIAWLLRHLPVFAVVGTGDYRLQPAYVEDVAELMVELGDRAKNAVVDAAGPEVYGYVDLVRAIRDAVGSRSLLLRVPQGLGYGLARVLGWALRDVLITREELVGLQRNLLVSREAPTCATRLGDWLASQRESVGRRYLSEMALHYRKQGRS